MLLASFNTINLPGANLLAQSQDWDWENLIYLGVIALFTVLNWIVGKYKEWTGNKDDEPASPGTSEGDVVYDVTLDDDDDFVLKRRSADTAVPAPSRPAPPRQPMQPRQPTKPRAPARPAQPVAQQAPRPPAPRPAAPRPVVAQPVQRQQAQPPRQTRSTQSQSSSRKRSSQQTSTRKRSVVVDAILEEPATMNIAGVPVRSLRDAVILSEVLAPPIAIRQIEGRSSGFDRPNL